MIYYGLVITGTNTGIGKTEIACGLAGALSEQGYKVGVFKPVETGCEERNGELIAQDGLRLLCASGCNLEIEKIVPYRFSLPSAPLVSAQVEEKEILFEKIFQIFDELAGEFDLLLVEDAGGLLVPFNENFLFADLIRPMHLPLLVVAENRLGAINQTLLTIESARAHELEVLGVILNQPLPSSAHSSLKNKEMIEKFSGVPVLAEIGYLSEPVREKEIKKICSALLDYLLPRIKESGRMSIFKYF